MKTELKGVLNTILKNAGITTLYLNKPKSNQGTHLTYKGKTIERPKWDRLHEVVFKEFSIDLKMFDYE